MEVIEDGVVMCVGKVRKAEIHARFKKKDKRKGFMMMAKGKMVYLGLFSISETLEDPKARIMAAKIISISRKFIFTSMIDILIRIFKHIMLAMLIP